MSNYQTSATSTTTTNITPLIWFDKDYLNSNAGLLKLIVVIIDLASFIVAQFAPSYGRVIFFCFTSMSAFWISLILFGFYAFHIIEKLYFVQWLLGEFAFCLIWCLFFAVSSLLMLLAGGVQTIAAIFGFIACGIYAYEAKNNYERYSRGEIAQGERITTPQTMA